MNFLVRSNGIKSETVATERIRLDEHCVIVPPARMPDDVEWEQRTSGAVWADVISELEDAIRAHRNWRVLNLINRPYKMESRHATGFLGGQHAREAAIVACETDNTTAAYYLLKFAEMHPQEFNASDLEVASLASKMLVPAVRHAGEPLLRLVARTLEDLRPACVHNKFMHEQIEKNVQQAILAAAEKPERLDVLRDTVAQPEDFQRAYQATFSPDMIEVPDRMKLLLWMYNKGIVDDAFLLLAGQACREEEAAKAVIEASEKAGWRAVRPPTHIPIYAHGPSPILHPNPNQEINGVEVERADYTGKPGVTHRFNIAAKNVVFSIDQRAPFRLLPVEEFPDKAMLDEARAFYQAKTRERLPAAWRTQKKGPASLPARQG